MDLNTGKNNHFLMARILIRTHTVGNNLDVTDLEQFCQIVSSIGTVCDILSAFFNSLIAVNIFANNNFVSKELLKYDFNSQF